ncbi:MAG: hypothetical protein WBP08_01500 [Saprospiraceae bacterium]
MTAKEKQKFINEILDIIEVKNITTIKGIVSYLPMQRATFYNNKFDKMDIIKEAIDSKKVKMKEGMRVKWYNSDNSTLQIALYKLLADKDEFCALTNNVTSKTEPGLFDDMTRDELIKETEIYIR